MSWQGKVHKGVGMTQTIEIQNAGRVEGDVTSKHQRRLVKSSPVESLNTDGGMTDVALEDRRSLIARANAKTMKGIPWCWYWLGAAVAGISIVYLWIFKVSPLFASRQ